MLVVKLILPTIIQLKREIPKKQSNISIVKKQNWKLKFLSFDKEFKIIAYLNKACKRKKDISLLCKQ